MEFFDVIKNRRSIRAYKKQDLSPEQLNQLIDAARLAPSAGNAQPWAFVVAKSEQTKQALATTAFGQSWLQEAAVVFVVCIDEKRAEDAYGVRGKTLYGIQVTSAAVETVTRLRHRHLEADDLHVKLFLKKRLVKAEVAFGFGCFSTSRNR